MAFDLDDEELEATRRLNGVGSMSEEEILKRIKYRVNELKLNYAIDNLDLKAMQGLLDLYNQEKEKNKKLEEGIRQIKDKLEIEDYYNCQDGADELTRLLKEVEE